MPYPAGQCSATVVDVELHAGLHDASTVPGSDCAWCLYGTGRSEHSSKTITTRVFVSSRRLPAVGAVFGCVLAFIGLASTGGGHGSYLTLSLAAAPVSWVPLLSVIGAPALWAGLGVLVRDGKRRAAGLILGAHTVASVGTIVLGSPVEPGSEQWAYFTQAQRVVPVLIWSGVLLYVLGLCLAWRLLLQTPSGESPPG